MSFSLQTLITSLLGRRPDLAISSALWTQLLDGLRERGRCERESGAFLLGPEGEPRRVTSIVFYDEVDSAAFDTGIIVIDGGCMADLWRICRERDAVVVADVHTHGGAAGQSDSDRKHPMIAEPGHVAIILPNFAAAPVQLGEMGLYRYRGRFKWDVLRPALLRPTLSITGG